MTNEVFIDTAIDTFVLFDGKARQQCIRNRTFPFIV